MKAVEEVVACVVDFGTFISVAEKLAETMDTVYYHSPFNTEYQDIRNCINGDGLAKVKRLDDFLDPEVLSTIDLFVFPDIGFSDVQRHLRSLGKAVFRHMTATDLDLYRDFFLATLQEVGLPTIHSEEFTGLTALGKHLKTDDNQNKWVKVCRYRANMETFHHQNYVTTARTLDSLAVIFGGAKETVKFVVQYDIKSDMEVGYDGWCIDGQYPSHSFQGYEKKNELYLGSVLSARDLPEGIQVVNAAMAPVLANYGYRNWWATEIRMADGIPYFIDPTPRMPGQTGEHQLESIANFADIVWSGANGIVLQPKFRWKVAAEATLHYELEPKDRAINDEGKTLPIPSEVQRWVKLYYYCQSDAAYRLLAENT